MESKTARLTVLIDPSKKQAFEELCAAQDLTPSQVVRQLIRDYLEKHDAPYSTRAVISKQASRTKGSPQ
jgi:antitoxin component of RelBE/YafQ-DinJ toxin-antitoxin module